MRLHFTSVLLYHFFSVSKSSSDPFNMHSRLCKLVKILIVCTNVYIISLNEKEKKNVCKPAFPVLCQLDNIQNLNFRLCIKTKDSCITLAIYFWLQYIQSKVRGRFHKNLWPSQNIWTLWSVLTEISVSLSTENFCVKQMKQANLYLTYNAQAEIRILNFIYC